MQRVVQPEILDGLPHDAPEAIRSRRDLRRINALMGNTRWLVGQLQKRPLASMVEIGAGDGLLCEHLAARRPSMNITALDRVPRPVGLPQQVQWAQGDLFEILPELKGEALVANLFLHHFEADALHALGSMLEGYRLICVSEPLRAQRAHGLGKLLHPFINAVTRHDMHVSIRAGFLPGEIPSLLSLNESSWFIREFSTWCGAQRMVAYRR